MFKGPRTYRVQRADREPLVRFMLEALEAQSCRIIFASEPTQAPFVITFETLSGERMGIVAYAFLATRTPTKNRPKDERSFQVKYGGKLVKNSHSIFQDPLGLFTTIFVGISPDDGFFVAVDPEVHNPTKFFIRIEFKDKNAADIKRNGWVAWERSRINREDEPAEVLIGGTKEHFLDLIRFERAAQGLDAGNRQLLSQKRELFSRSPSILGIGATLADVANHPLAKELALSPEEVLDVIANARRLKMAVRGWVAERHLKDILTRTPGVTYCAAIDQEGSADLHIRVNEGPLLTVECKNVLRETDAKGLPRLDFQRTRTSKKDPCSRYYAPSDFDVVAACLHAVTEKWEFRYILPQRLPVHGKCVGKLASNLRVDEKWQLDPIPVFQAATGASRQ
jgi:Methylase-associated X1